MLYPLQKKAEGAYGQQINTEAHQIKKSQKISEKLLTNRNSSYIIGYADVEQTTQQVGVFSDEGPPVPIPNTEVKLISADNTWLEAAREDKAMPTQ